MYSREPEVTETVPLSFRGSQGGWPRWQESADHLNCPVGKPVADWRGINRWREGEGTVVGRSSSHPSRQLSHMGFTEPKDGGRTVRERDKDVKDSDTNIVCVDKSY